jgi:hypothetical protein
LPSLSLCSWPTLCSAVADPTSDRCSSTSAAGEFGASLSIKDFVDIFWHRREDSKIKIPKSMEAAFIHPQSDEEREIKALIDEFNAGQATKFEQELFKQRKRLADAQRSLQSKTTKAALENQRIATDRSAGRWTSWATCAAPNRRTMTPGSSPASTHR